MTYRYPGGLVRRTAANTSITGASGVWDLGSQAQAVKTNTWPISGLANPVSGSLRFRRSASAYLNRTPASAGNRKTFTYSGWVKRGGSFGVDQTIFGCNNGNSNANAFEIFFTTSNTIGIIEWDFYYLATTQVFRDPAAWYHIVLAVDTTNATANNRIRLYINGVEVTAFGTRTNPTQNADLALNNTIGHQIGAINYVSSGGLTRYFDGYMAEVNFVDGQALTPSSFGQTSSITGVWEPIKYTGTYGTNGFYLSLSDTSSIGKDFSGNGNNWSPNNISTANDSTFDLMRDVPTQWAPQGVTDIGGTVRGNYCTLNPIQRYDTSSAAGTYSSANLIFASGGIPTHAFGTMAIPPGNTDGWYWEGVCTSMDTARTYIGILSPADGPASVGAPYAFNTKGVWSRTGDYYQTQTNGTADANYASYTTNDVLMVAYKNGKLWFGKNGTWVNSGNPAADTGAASTTLSTSKEWFPYFGYNSTWSTNFGQRPFTYTPPSGFKSLCTTNLPTPTIGATVATAANKYFDATLYNGTGATLSVTNAGGFQPDFVWLKSRSATTNHQAFDTVRGATKVSVINAAEAESTSANTITSFNSNGFTVGTNTAINTSSATYVAWQWWAGGSTVTNTTGSISAQVRASTTTGFSIATYTGNGTGGATIGHGLGAAPSMLIFRNRDAADNSALVWHTGFNTNQGQVLLSSTAAIFNPGNGLYFNSTTPGSSVVTLGTSGATNGSGSNMIMYAWTPIAGFSAFGSYTGNGVADGPFVYLGFRPRYFIFKNITSTQSWSVQDTSRSPFNVGSAVLLPNSTTAELTGTDFIDIVSNGFKIRHSSSGNNNNSGDTYIYAAFAEHPFKNSLAR